MNILFIADTCIHTYNIMLINHSRLKIYHLIKNNCNCFYIRTKKILFLLLKLFESFMFNYYFLTNDCYSNYVLNVLRN